MAHLGHHRSLKKKSTTYDLSAIASGMSLRLRKISDLNVNWSKILKGNKGCSNFVLKRQKRIASRKWEWPSYWCLWKARIRHTFMVNLRIYNNFQFADRWIILIDPTPWCFLSIRFSSTQWYPIHTWMLPQGWLISLWWFLIYISVSVSGHIPAGKSGLNTESKDVYTF